ncbi:MAG: FkbM family methyltransferase [Candidatus Melainabacteria bacterium]|nr:FkbM family methyltransferase [Candidatus Melainabacteria bacterium]
MLNTEDKREYVRVLSVCQDKHILKTLLENLKPGETCWDVGSNIGLYTVLLAKAVGEKGKVVAFEPEEKSFERLLQNVELNKLGNVCPFRMALGQKNEKMQLKVHGHYASGAHSLVVSNGSSSNANECESVDVVQGDDLIVKKNLEIPKVIKIDVEGAEEDVLVGLKSTLHDKRCSLVVCEVHFSILASSGRKDVPLKIIQYLKDCGFNNLTWLDPSHLAARKEDN